MQIYSGFSKQSGVYGKTKAYTDVRQPVSSLKDKICFGGPFEQERDGVDDKGRDREGGGDPDRRSGG